MENKPSRNEALLKAIEVAVLDQENMLDRELYLDYNPEYAVQQLSRGIDIAKYWADMAFEAGDKDLGYRCLDLSKKYVEAVVYAKTCLEF